MKTSPLAKFLSVSTIVLLVTQYLSGMAVNLFDSNLDNAAIPGSNFFDKTNQAFEYAQNHGSIFLQIHYWNASLLLLSGLALLVVGIFLRNRSIWLQAIFFGLTLFLIAHVGAAFIAYHDEYYSYAMAGGYLIALGFAISICSVAFNRSRS